MISVLLPHRGEPTLREAAESVLADMGPHDELVLVDDAVSAFRDDVVDPRIVRVRSGGVGIARALAIGVDASRGELLARMDADDVSLPGRLRAQRELLESDVTLGAVAVQVEAFGGPAAGLARYVAWQNALVTPDDHARSIYVESPLCHPATMMRRSAIVSAGGYRDGPWPEDWDLFLRIFRAGWRFAKVPRVLFRWRRTGTNVTSQDERCGRDRLVDLRAFHLAAELSTFGVWGAGRTGRRLARALATRGVRASFFVDIDPDKIGRRAYGVPIVDPDEGTRLAHGGVRLVVAVGAPGARDVVRARLLAANVEETTGFICA